MGYLTKAIQTKEVNTYQLLAGIGAEHCLARDFVSTNWQSIYQQYTILETLDPGFLITMNKLIAYYYLGHHKEAISALEDLKSAKDFRESANYYLALGTLYVDDKNIQKALFNLSKALSLTQHEREIAIIQKRLVSIDSI